METPRYSTGVFFLIWITNEKRMSHGLPIIGTHLVGKSVFISFVRVRQNAFGCFFLCPCSKTIRLNNPAFPILSYRKPAVS